MEEMDKFIVLAVTLVITFFTIFVINRIFKTVYQRKPKIHIKFLHSILNALILVVGVYVSLSQFSVAREISGVLLQSGSLILAVATFAAQQALGNVISGFSISASKPCDIGQKIRIMSGGTIIAEGIVTDMTARHIVINQYDGQSCIIPNSIVDSSVIVNTNYISDVGNALEFEVAYGTDLEAAKKLIRDICQEDSLVIRADGINVLTSRLTANGVVLKFVVFTKTLDENFQACSNIREKVLTAFKEHGIDIPYQTVTVRKE